MKSVKEKLPRGYSDFFLFERLANSTGISFVDRTAKLTNHEIQHHTKQYQMPDFAVATANTNNYISRIGKEIILLPLKFYTFACFIHTHLENIHFKCVLQLIQEISEQF